MSLAAVLDYYGVQYRLGRTNQKVRCVIHGERDPSMSVNLDKGAFKCHSCGAAGGYLQFIMEKEGLDYVAARKFASDLGITDSDAGGHDEPLPSWAVAGGGRVPGGSGDRSGDGGYVPPWCRH